MLHFTSRFSNLFSMEKNWTTTFYPTTVSHIISSPIHPKIPSWAISLYNVYSPNQSQPTSMIQSTPSPSLPDCWLPTIPAANPQTTFTVIQLLHDSHLSSSQMQSRQYELSSKLCQEPLFILVLLYSSLVYRLFAPTSCIIYKKYGYISSWPVLQPLPFCDML